MTTENLNEVPEERWSMQKGDCINLLQLVGPVYMSSDSYSRQIGLFACKCGETKYLLLDAVKSSKTKSCGCLNRQLKADRIRKYNESRKSKKRGTLASNGLKICEWKDCSHKGAYQPIINFNADSSKDDRLRIYCKLCENTMIYERKYGRPFSDFQDQLRCQGGRCDFCGKPFDDANYMLRAVQDHNHETSANRGVLHNVCNLFVANFENLPEMFPFEMCPAVTVYLRKWESSTINANHP